MSVLDGSPSAQRFRVRGPLLLQGGGKDTKLFETDEMTGRLKIYADGGENDLHAHPGEDHAFIVLDGEAVFFDKDGNETHVGKYDGILLPRGAFYRFRSCGSGNVVLLRVAVGAKFDGPGVYRIGPDGEPLRHNPTMRAAGTEEPVYSGLFFGDDVLPRAYEGPMISADSHVIESPTLYSERLPAALRDRAPQWPSKGKAFQGHPGGWDPNARLGEMATDGVSAEVLFPSLALRLFAMKDAELQQACFRVYNDWLAEYCSVAPDRLIGIALISAYDVDQAAAEVRRCSDLGMRGVQLWQVPPEGLEFANNDHYDKLWATIAELGMPLSLHILSGFDWSRRTHEDLSEEDSQDRDIRNGGFLLRGMTNYKLLSVTNALHDLLLGGALERHPQMKLSLVESEIGWIPFVLERWDKYFRRPSRPVPTISTLPSELFARQVYPTFIDDEYGTRQLSWWGAANCMWSSDFPHVASSWPDSRQVISGCLAGLAPAQQERLAWRNCAELYGLETPGAPVPAP